MQPAGHQVQSILGATYRAGPYGSRSTTGASHGPYMGQSRAIWLREHKGQSRAIYGLEITADSKSSSHIEEGLWEKVSEWERKRPSPKSQVTTTGCILKINILAVFENNQKAVFSKQHIGWFWKQPIDCILKTNVDDVNTECTWFEDTPYNPPICGVARLTAITIQATRLYAFVLWPAARAIATTSVDQRVPESMYA